MNSACEYAIESNCARFCGYWHKSSTFTQSDFGGESGLESFAAEVPPFKCFIARYKCV